MSELHDCIPNIVREDAIDQQKKKKRPALDYVNHQKETYLRTSANTNDAHSATQIAACQTPSKQTNKPTN